MLRACAELAEVSSEASLIRKKFDHLAEGQGFWLWQFRGILRCAQNDMQRSKSVSDWETFLKNLSKAPIEEGVHYFRHEALRSLHMAIACATLLQKEVEGSSQLPDEVEQWSHLLLHHLDEIRQLLNVFPQPPNDGASE